VQLCGVFLMNFVAEGCIVTELGRCSFSWMWELNDYLFGSEFITKPIHCPSELVLMVFGYVGNR
jgi:hypothetical protein